MSFPRWLFFVVISVGCTIGGVSSARAQIDEVTARAYEKSRQQEAVGAYAAAVAAMQSATPDSQQTYPFAVRMGWLMFQAGNHEASIGFFRRALSLGPASIEARMQMMLPLMAAKRFADAETIAAEVLQVDRHNLAVRTRLAKIQYGTSHFSEAAATFHDILVDYPADVDVAAGYAWALLKMNRTEEAYGVFRNVLTVAPSNVSAQEGYRLATTGQR